MKVKKIILIISISLFVNNLLSQELPQLQVSFYNTIYLYFPDKIVSTNIGYDRDFEVTSENNEVKITTLTDSIDYKTNFTIKTKSSLFAFDLVYKERPDKTYHFILYDSAIHSFNEKERSRNIPISYKKTKTPERHIRSDTKVKDSICEKIYNFKNLDIINGIVDEKIFFGLGKIFIHENRLYFPLIVRNDSNLDYDINFIKFKTEGKKTTKKSAFQEEYKEPSHIYNGCKTVPSKNYICQIVVFDKFTLPSKKYFYLELSERNGTRHLKFHISKKDILNSKII